MNLQSFKHYHDVYDIHYQTGGVTIMYDIFQKITINPQKDQCNSYQIFIGAEFIQVEKPIKAEKRKGKYFFKLNSPHNMHRKFSEKKKEN